MSRPSLLLVMVLAAAACGRSNVKACEANDPNCPLACGSGVDSPPNEGRTHVPVGTPVTYTANPPASGNHWPVWESWKVFPSPIPRENWVHNLEHGGIVLAYNCGTESCADQIDQLSAIRSSRPPDQFNIQRIIVTPDPEMPEGFAAIAWDWRWRGDTIDETAINCFIDARYDRAPESLP